MCPAVEIFSFSTLLCFTLGPGLHVTYLIYRTAKRKADFVRPQPPSRDYWGFPWRVMGPILADPGAVSRVGRKGGKKVFKYEGKSPWIPTLINLSGWRVLIGHKKCFVLLWPINNNWQTVSAGFFSWVRTQRLLSCHTFPVCAPSLCVQGKLLFSTFLTRNKGTTVLPSKKRFGCYQREQFNLPREHSVFDSSQYIVNNGKFKMRWRESQISNSLARQKNTLHIHHTFLYISLPSTAWPPVKKPNQSCFVKDVNKQWQNSFSSWTWISLIEIQLQKSLFAFDKVSQLE